MNTEGNYLRFLEEQIKENYMIRGRKFQKARFRDFIISEMNSSNFNAQEVNYKQLLINSINVESNVERSRVIFTAHYDTPPLNFSFLYLRIIKAVQKLFGINMFSSFIGCVLILVILSIVPRFGLILILIDITIFLFGILFMKNKNNMIDNTSGVIGLLNLAKLFNGNEDIGFIFFDNEEIGLLGSKGAAKRLYKERINMKDKLIINLDCICSKSNLDKWLISTTKYNKTTIDQRDKFINLLAEKINLVQKSKAAASDYKSFKKNSSLSIGKYSKGLICGNYIKDIHSNKDKLLYIDDINILTSNLYNICANIMH